MTSQLHKLAAAFQTTLDLSNELPPELPPVSRQPASKQPISIEPQRDLQGGVKLDMHKYNRFVLVSLLESTQKELAQGIAHSLKRHGFDVDPSAIQKHLLQFGDYSDSEERFAKGFTELLNHYSDKAVHYIINNLSW